MKRNYITSLIKVDIDFYINEKHVAKIDSKQDIEFEEYTYTSIDPYEPSEHEVTLLNENDLIMALLEEVVYDDSLNKLLFKTIIDCILYELIDRYEFDLNDSLMTISEEISIEDYLEKGIKGVF